MKLRRIHIVAIVAAILYVGTVSVLGVIWGADTGAKTAGVTEGQKGGGDPDAGAAIDEARVSAFEAAQTLGIAGVPDPIEHISTPGWAKELPFSKTQDDWEPAIAADDAGHVYMLTTRYGAQPACTDCPKVFIALKRSMDGGATWLPDQYLCECEGMGWQADPVLVVDDSGRVFAIWLQGFKPGIAFTRSDDFGATWTAPQWISGMTDHWSDKPWIATSGDGEDAYVFFNGWERGTPYVSISHDAGDTWSQVHLPDFDNLGRYFYADGATVLPDGTVLGSQAAWRQGYKTGRVRTFVFRSADEGATWSRVPVGTYPWGNKCPEWAKCGYNFLGPTLAITSDDAGNAYALGNGGKKPHGPGRVWFRSSTDGGATWSLPSEVSEAPEGADHEFPMLTATGDGRVTAAWQDDRTGAWNTWLRQSTDGGLSWGPEVRISNATSGAPYKSHAGYRFPYGDYGMLATGQGRVWAIWGESVSYYGPGGSWFMHST